jgi:hypothetical protein
MSDVQHELETSQRVSVRVDAKPQVLTASHEAERIALNYHMPRRGALFVERVLQLEETVRVLKQQVEVLKLRGTVAKPASVAEPERYKRRAD